MSGVLVVRVLGALAAFAASIAIGRTLGASWTGTYFVATAIVGIAVSLGRVGLDLPTMRIVSVAIGDSDWPRAHSVARKALLLVFGVSALLSALIVALAPLLGDVFSDSSLPKMLRIVGLAVVPMALLLILARLLMSVEHATLAESLQRFLPSVGVALGVVILSNRVGGLAAGVSFSLAYLGAFIGAWLAWRHFGPPRTAVVPVSAMELLRPGLPLLLVVSVGLIIGWSDILMIGAMLPAREAGIYGAATRLSGVVAFVLIATGTVMGPRFARLYESGRRAELAVAFRTSAKLSGLVALPLSICLIVASSFAMGLFGPDFATGRAALVILVLGQLVNAAVGLVGVLLAMAGRERRLMQSSLAVGVLNLVLNLLLIPRLGITGAAFATATSLALLNIVNLAFVKRDLGITLLRRQPSVVVE